VVLGYPGISFSIISMACRICSLEHDNDLDAEVTIHLPGQKDLEKNPLVVFPRIRVCMACGFTEFTLESKGLTLLRAAIE